MRAIYAEDAASLLANLDQEIQFLIKNGIDSNTEKHLELMAQIVLKISNCLTDRAPVNFAFAKLLETYKETWLPFITSRIDELSPAARKHLVPVQSFGCLMHLISNIGENN
jgi:hypothetical protein